MKKIFMLFLIFVAASFLSAEEIKKEETPAVQQVEESEANDHKTEKETPVLQIEEHEEKEEPENREVIKSDYNYHRQHKSFEFPITLGLFGMLENDLNLFTFFMIFYPPISVSVINLDSKFDGGSVYELANNNSFYRNDFFEFGLHMKVDLEIFYRSLGAGGGLGTGLYMIFDETILIKAGGRAGLYKTVPYAGPEASITFLTGDSTKLTASYCYGFTSDHRKLWHASLSLGFYAD